MVTLVFVLFISGILTILLPCILPLVPIVLGTSVAGNHPLRPLMVILGMLVSFVVFTVLLTVVFASFPLATDYIRIATYDVLLLFGVGFLTHHRGLHILAAFGGSLFFWPNVGAVIIAFFIGSIAMIIGSRIASGIQNIGGSLQKKTQDSVGIDHPLGAFFMGMTLGFVWVPCAGPALGFVFTLLRDRPGLEAVVLLTSYGVGTALPLLLIGYGGRFAVRSVRALSRFSGRVKQVAGCLLVLSAFALHFHWFRSLETWLVLNTSYGTYGIRIEEMLYNKAIGPE